MQSHRKMPHSCFRFAPVAIHAPLQFGTAAEAEVSRPSGSIAVARRVRHVIASGNALNNLSTRAAGELPLCNKPLQRCFSSRRFCSAGLSCCGFAAHACVWPLTAQHAEHVAAAPLWTDHCASQRVWRLRRLHGSPALWAVHKADARCSHGRLLMPA